MKLLRKSLRVGKLKDINDTMTPLKIKKPLVPEGFLIDPFANLNNEFDLTGEMLAKVKLT